MIMMTSDEDLWCKVIDGLLLYEEDFIFIRTFVKIGFWIDQRPDIAEILGVKECTDIVVLGKEIVRKIVTYTADNPTSENKQILGIIGCMPIVSKEYSPHCMISYTAGLIRDVKNEGITMIRKTKIMS